jgi:hypothetical protein
MAQEAYLQHTICIANTCAVIKGPKNPLYGAVAFCAGMQTSLHAGPMLSANYPFPTCPFSPYPYPIYPPQPSAATHVTYLTGRRRRAGIFLCLIRQVYCMYSPLHQCKGCHCLFYG